MRQRWELPDGDFLDVDRLEADPLAPHVVVLHGLEGSSRAGYVAAILRGARLRGWGAIAPNFRSCSGELNRLPRFYHSGETGDLALVLERLATEVRGPLLGVGFSLGGNVLLRFLAETGERSPLVAAAGVSVPFDLERSARELDRGAGWTALYRHVFLRSLRRKALAKAACHPGAIDPGAVAGIRGIVAYDDVVTAPLHGFPDAATYYRSCSSGPSLGAIRVPTLLLSSLDDPLVPGDSIPGDRSSPWLSWLLTEKGGHVGFVGGKVWKPRFWAEEEVLCFLGGQVG